MARIRKQSNTDIKNECKKAIWYIAIYIRLSKDDGNDESLSVTNQKKIIIDYLEHYFEEEFSIVDFYIDDGLTGTDYERPDFQRMLHDIEIRKVNCVICKNLSRAFRNYSDQGYFLENYFPLHSTRFITISDPKVDSFLRPETIQNLEVPITGLMNDRFACRTSNDVRETLYTKRRKGEFIGAFAPYGYKKDPGDKNHLIIDEDAAQIVRDIFNWFIFDGLSKIGITKKLNELGVPNPTSYKRQNGFRYNNPHVHDNDGLWAPSTVARILRNQMYIGNMVQGRQKVISYKVHDRVSIPEEEWVIKENMHEPVIDKEIFDKAQSMHQHDTRTSPAKKELYLFSGFLRCAECNKALTRKKSKGRVYYACRTYKDKSITKCTSHSIREDVLYEAVLTAIRTQIDLIESLKKIVEDINKAPIIRIQSKRLINLLKLRKQELGKLTSVIDNLYFDWKSGDISKEDYRRMKDKFEEQSEQLKQTIENLNDEIRTIAEGISTDEPYLGSFLKYRNINRLERGILVELIDTIFVCAGGEIKIEFTFADQYKRVVDFIINNRRELSVAEN